jgi:anaerobic selenocysteine-containing dehydrogenase
LIYNEYGAVLNFAHVTDDIMPGVASLDEGQWYKPDGLYMDTGGCANVLLVDRRSPMGAFPSNSCNVEIVKNLTGIPPIGSTVA